MSKYYRIKVSRPCDIWKYSKNDGAGNLTQIVFAYDFDSEDCLFGQNPYYFATKRLFEELEEGSFTGFKLVPVITKYSDLYRGKREMENVMRVVISGVGGQDDLGMQGKTTVVVSDRILNTLNRFGSKDIKVFDFDPEYKVEIPQWLVDGIPDDE